MLQKLVCNSTIVFHRGRLCLPRKFQHTQQKKRGGGSSSAKETPNTWKPSWKKNKRRNNNWCFLCSCRLLQQKEGVDYFFCCFLLFKKSFLNRYFFSATFQQEDLSRNLVVGAFRAHGLFPRKRSDTQKTKIWSRDKGRSICLLRYQTALGKKKKKENRKTWFSHIFFLKKKWEACARAQRGRNNFSHSSSHKLPAFGLCKKKKLKKKLFCGFPYNFAEKISLFPPPLDDKFGCGREKKGGRRVEREGRDSWTTTTSCLSPTFSERKKEKKNNPPSSSPLLVRTENLSDRKLRKQQSGKKKKRKKNLDRTFVFKTSLKQHQFFF